ncbi:MAG: UTP--glucose-1-phosphate uridylyltransferase [Chlamydiales bacterium]|nr:UTP--glucose-1-phosphate uridylyltransferase [Chlamydiales bacterium]
MMHDYQGNYTPLHSYSTPKPATYIEGQALVKKGKVAAIILAGGHGSRLGYDAPKGCFPLIGDKSLYSFFADKVRVASAQYGHKLLLAIMTSDATHEQTLQHFEDHAYFGLDSDQVCFFQQQNLPLQDESGTICDLTAPDGNGALFWHMAKSGLLNTWDKQGVEYFTVCTVDNVLVDLFQPDLIGLHAQKGNDITVVGITRNTPQEQVGVLVEKDNKLAVVEYSEMHDSERLATNQNGSLKYPLANISYFCMSMDFAKKMVQLDKSVLPIHKAKKKVQSSYFYKSEYFIFDLLAFCHKAEVLLLPRTQYFAPLKSSADIPLVQAALSSMVKKTFND